jgi:hypothetical protein
MESKIARVDSGRVHESGKLGSSKQAPLQGEKKPARRSSRCTAATKRWNERKPVLTSVTLFFFLNWGSSRPSA